MSQNFNGKLATASDTRLCTAILEAGRRSLDADGQAIRIEYHDDRTVSGLSQS